MGPDFSGYVTRYGVRCTDGRTIMAHAFKGMDKQQIPLVWQHQHNSSDNVLGHLVLEHKDDGVYAQAFFNDTPSGQNAKKLVKHKDVQALSIYANELVQQGKSVTHGAIREGSLVLAGANPGAFIDNVYIQHGDGDPEALDGEVIIYSGEPLVHADGGAPVVPPKPAVIPEPTNPEPIVKHDDTEGTTVEEILNSLSPVQLNTVYALIGQAVNHSAVPGDPTNPEGTPVPRNVFDQNKDGDKTDAKNVLSHEDVKGIVADAMKGGSLKEAVENYALAHGIENIDTLFPDARAVTDTPDWISRRMEWVASVIGGTRHTPFSRIKSMTADITQDEARAKGYIKGNLKKEEFFSIAKRVTTPQTIYKKQKLDRDDILDITDFDVVAWLKGEMRVMLDEELARAVLIGDGREVDDDDKINESNIRPVANDAEMYNTTVYVNIDDSSSSVDEIIDAVVMAMSFYRGSGNPTFYTTQGVISKFGLLKDSLGRRIYPTAPDVAAAMGVKALIPVEAMEGGDADLIGVIVNLQDYVLGADKGGDVNMFDDFDIDYNQYKYLIETRVSGALVKYKSAMTVRKVASADVLTVPGAPTQSGNTVTCPTDAKVVYTATDRSGGSVTITSHALTLTTGNTPVTVQATPASGYYFGTSENDSWTFEYQA